MFLKKWISTTFLFATIPPALLDFFSGFTDIKIPTWVLGICFGITSFISSIAVIRNLKK